MTCIRRTWYFVFAIMLPSVMATAGALVASQSDDTSSAMRGVSSEARARFNYALNCQGCHLGDGAGMAGKVPAMKGVVSRFLSAPGGREYLVRVPGMTNAAVSDEELAEIANWMLYTFDPRHMPDNFTPYTAREVAASRVHPYTVEAAEIRRRLLAGLNDTEATGKSTDKDQQGRSAQ